MTYFTLVCYLPFTVHLLLPHSEFLFEQKITLLDEETSHGPVILRSKRAAAKEKNTCQLFIQTDHFFYKYYGSREAVIAQVCTQPANTRCASDFRVDTLLSAVF